MSSLVYLLKESKGAAAKGSTKFNVEDFKSALSQVKALGQFTPLGGEQTAAQHPGDWVSIGHSSQWLWYSVYAR